MGLGVWSVSEFHRLPGVFPEPRNLPGAGVHACARAAFVSARRPSRGIIGSGIEEFRVSDLCSRFALRIWGLFVESKRQDGLATGSSRTIAGFIFQGLRLHVWERNRLRFKMTS